MLRILIVIIKIVLGYCCRFNQGISGHIKLAHNENDDNYEDEDEDDVKDDDLGWSWAVAICLSGYNLDMMIIMRMMRMMFKMIKVGSGRLLSVNQVIICAK